MILIWEWSENNQCVPVHLVLAAGFSWSSWSGPSLFQTQLHICKPPRDIFPQASWVCMNLSDQGQCQTCICSLTPPGENTESMLIIPIVIILESSLPWNSSHQCRKSETQQSQQPSGRPLHPYNLQEGSHSLIFRLFSEVIMTLFILCLKWPNFQKCKEIFFEF